MALYIVQHGISLPTEVDPEKGLSPQGREQVERIAGVAENYGVRVDRIDHSGKKRARQTAEIMAASLKPRYGCQAITGIGPLDDVAAFAPCVDFAADTMIVGHLPFLQKLTTFLITGSLSPIVFKLQNGGILCLDYMNDSASVAIKWALMPEVG